ncbi:hypothetical protein AMK13_34880 [Streptomyces sp. CB02056]|nr:hypothetical protein AMK13_34880 [Streptomyces sp. CB02056]
MVFGRRQDSGSPSPQARAAQHLHPPITAPPRPRPRSPARAGRPPSAPPCAPARRSRDPRPGPRAVPFRS